MLAIGAGADLLENAGVPAKLPSGKPDPGIVGGRDVTTDAALADFIVAIGKHRHHAREMDPPEV